MENNNIWDLTYFYKNDDAFQQDLEKLKAFIPQMASYQGKLSDENAFADFLRLERDCYKLQARLFFYASMRCDRDRKNTPNNAEESKVYLISQQLGEAMSYADPEILSLGKEKIDEFLAKHKDFEDFSFSFEKLFRGQDHVLSADKEKLLSAFAPLYGEAGQLYSMLAVSDYSAKEVTLSDGKVVNVSVSNWTTLIEQAEKAEDRQAIFEGLYSYFDMHKNAFGEIYNMGLQAQIAEKKAHNYDSVLASHLYKNAIPEEVFHNLIQVASEGSAPLKKYYQLRAKALGLSAHRSYDRFLALAKSDKKYGYEDGKNLFWSSVSSFPADFQEKAHEVLKEGFVDVYPSDGKRSGAYSNGGYDFHPYILLNYNGTLDDVFTLAHESGHSIHTLYSMESQPMLKQDYTIFVAEIASTFNEHNLLDYLLTHEELSKEDRIYLLQKAIDEICSTFYRQTLFGHFEYLAAKKAENGEPINHEVLSSIMVDLYKQYYGIDISEEKVKPLVWAYIPHFFYTPFYVYQYATSFTSSMLIYQKVKAKEEGAFENYLNLLRSGGSEYPVSQVKKAGVDLTTKEPYLAVIHRMEQLVDQLEKELDK